MDDMEGAVAGADEEANGGNENVETDSTPGHPWFVPLDGDACGEDLEYDNDFLELTQAAAGRPATQFAEAEPPDWRDVSAKAEALFERTRDLRIAVLWLRAQVAVDGWGALPEGLRVLHGLLDRFWDELHPRPDADDGDAYARINALEALVSTDHLRGDLRLASILRNRMVGELRGRDLEIAFQHLEARDDESPPSRGQIEQMLREAAAEDPALFRLAADSNERLDAITALMRERVGYERAPGFEALHALLNELQQVLPSPVADEPSAGGGDLDEGQTPMRTSRAKLGDSIDSRDDALRAIDMVCDFLERTEPTNPAQLLLRRAQRLVNKNFLELVQELAPDALAEVARVMGVSPDSIGGGGSRGDDDS